MNVVPTDHVLRKGSLVSRCVSVLLTHRGVEWSRAASAGVSDVLAKVQRRWVVALYPDSSICLWDTATRRILRTSVLRMDDILHNVALVSLACGLVLVLPGLDAPAAATPSPVLQSCQLHALSTNSFLHEWDPCGCVPESASRDSARKPKRIPLLEQSSHPHHDGAPPAVAFGSPCAGIALSRHLAVLGTSSGFICVWSAISRRVQAWDHIEDDTPRFLAMALAPAHRDLHDVYDDGRARQQANCPSGTRRHHHVITSTASQVCVWCIVMLLDDTRRDDECVVDASVTLLGRHAERNVTCVADASTPSTGAVVAFSVAKARDAPAGVILIRPTSDPDADEHVMMPGWRRVIPVIGCDPVRMLVRVPGTCVLLVHGYLWRVLMVHVERHCLIDTLQRAPMPPLTLQLLHGLRHVLAVSRDGRCSMYHSDSCIPTDPMNFLDSVEAVSVFLPDPACCD